MIVSACNMRMPVTEEIVAAANHNAFCEYYRKGYGDCTCGAAINLCGKEVVRDGMCEEHKVERRKSLYSERRKPGSSDSPPSCGNSMCHVEFGQTRHHNFCPDYGPGWA